MMIKHKTGKDKKLMGKVWLKTKYDSGLKIEIPHSINFANAMYGFLEMGAEIIPYHTIDEIYDKVEREDIPVYQIRIMSL